MERNNRTIQVKVRRSKQGENDSHFDMYEIPFEVKMSVFNALEYIGNKIDPSLAFYASCRIGKCMGCVMRINGKRGLVGYHRRFHDIYGHPVNVAGVN